MSVHWRPQGDSNQPDPRRALGCAPLESWEWARDHPVRSERDRRAAPWSDIHPLEGGIALMLFNLVDA